MEFMTLEEYVKFFMEHDPLAFTKWAIKTKKKYGVEWPMNLVNENNLIVRNKKERK